MAEVSNIGMPGMEEIGQLIRLKERELHEIHDMRCANLEKLVEERDGLVAEATKRFEQLKEDFSYNLILLGARDEEIDRLETELITKTEELTKNEGDRRSLVSKVEVLELRDTERAEKHLHEKNNSKRILQELRDVIESMKWAASEDSKSKAREIDVLREDNRVLAASREESLESQRRDLTATFEQLILHREKHFNAREKKLGAKVLAMDERLEELGTDNSRLKSELQGALRTIEVQEKDLLQNKEKIQSQHWQLEDERGSSQRSIDVLERQVQALNAELLSVRDAAEQTQTALHGQVETTKQDAEREKEFREVLEKRLADYRDTTKSSASHLEAEVASHAASETRLRSELLHITAERDSLQELCERSKMEAAAGARRTEALQEELEGKEAELSKTRRAIEDGREREMLGSAEAQLAARKTEEMAERVKGLEQAMEQASREVLSSQETTKEALERVAALESLLKEEKAEGEALKLRIRLQESQVHALKSDAGEPTTTTSGQAKTPAPGMSEEETIKAAATGGGSGTLGLGIDQAEATSPIFSEDFGPVSLPASPLATPNPNYTGGLGPKGSAEGGFGMGLRGPPRTQTTSIDMHPTAATVGDTTKSNYDIVNSGLAQENERLKQVVKEMRRDVESLQQQVLDQSHMAETGALAGAGAGAGASGVPEDYEELQKRLEKTAAEVVRLKAERKTLMDIGNELRSALNREYGGEMIASAAGASAGRAAGGIPPPRTLAFYPQQQQQRAGPGAGAGSGPMYFNYQYDASAIATARHFQQEEARRAAADQPPSDAIAMINAFEGDHPDQHQATSDNVSGIGVRGRGVPNTGNNYNRGYGATAGRTGVNTHGRYGATTGANKATSSSSVRHPTANAATRAASAQTRSGPRKVMNYARGDEKEG